MPLHRTPTLGSSADEMEGGGGGFRYTLACHGGPIGGSGPDCHACFVFLGSNLICRLYTLTLSDLAEVTLQRKSAMPI